MRAPLSLRRGIMLVAVALVAALAAGCGGRGDEPAHPAAAPATTSGGSTFEPDKAEPVPFEPNQAEPTQFEPTQFEPTQFQPVQFEEVRTEQVQVSQGDGLTLYTLPADVLFDFDKADIRPDARAALESISASIAKRFPDAPLEIRGHTDAKGADGYNQDLSERRAASVKAWLAGQGGIETGRMVTFGFGETKPVAPNTRPDGSDDPAGRQRNRRVEVLVKAS
jgi:outer membrane protein OmpA-like peptidoglycan-associated protein